MSATIKSPVTKKREADLGEIAFQRLMQAIASGELKEGERVKESRVAQEWNIGVTPIREAVRRVAALGYLVLKPNHAPIVRRLSREDISQIHGVREALEGFALESKWNSLKDSELARLRKMASVCERAKGVRRFDAMIRFDEELHGLWTTETKNPWLESSLERVVLYFPRLTKSLMAHADYMETSFLEHLEILGALEERNRGKALRLLANHIRQAGKILADLTQGELKT